MKACGEEEKSVLSRSGDRIRTPEDTSAVRLGGVRAPSAASCLD